MGCVCGTVKSSERRGTKPGNFSSGPIMLSKIMTSGAVQRLSCGEGERSFKTRAGLRVPGEYGLSVRRFGVTSASPY